MKVWAVRIAAIVTVAALTVAALLVAAERQDQEPVWLEQARAWDDLPLSVGWDREAWGGHSESFSEALETVNRAVGCDLLKPAPLGRPARVRILPGGPPCGAAAARALEEDAAGAAWLCPDGTAEVRISKPGLVTQSYLIAYHELGHVLGLAHDGKVTAPSRATFVSIMADNAPAHADRLGQGLHLPILSAKDAQALRDRYCSAGE